MDDLFREAAARYPLKAGGSDWESLAEKLKTAGKLQDAAKPGKLVTNLWLLLIIPLAFLVHNSFKTSSADYVTAIPSSGQSGLPEKRLSVIVPEKKTEARKVEKAPAINTSKENSGQQELMILHSPVPVIAALENQHIAVDIPGPGDRLPIQPAPLPGQPAKKRHAGTGFYFGPLAAFDLGSVKGQSFAKAGYGLGFIAGYRISKRLSIESGISFIQKRYYTSGEQFDMKKIESSMPGGMEMIDVRGKLSLFEIPYKLKYDFRLREQSNLFIAAGASTNIYLKESNDYFTSMNGTQQRMNASYTDLHCAPLCLAHVSAGYEQLLKNKSSIRFEPYIKFPLRKVGVGSVPVLSIGLNVSISNFTGR